MRDREQELIDASRRRKEIAIQDKGKTVMEILGIKESSLKRSTINRSVLFYVSEFTKMLNARPYQSRKYSEQEVTRWAMYRAKGPDYDYELSKMFVQFDEWSARGELADYASQLRQTFDMLNSRKAVKEGKLVASWDIEEDGFPRPSRGSLCYLFCPVEGELEEGLEGTTLTLYNPRRKKDEGYNILRGKKDGYLQMYEADGPGGKKVFLVEKGEVEDAWDALFSVNKEIFAGWWNKVLVRK